MMGRWSNVKDAIIEVENNQSLCFLRRRMSGRKSKIEVINILYNLVDKMFIGHIPKVGKQALAGIGITTPVILAISAFAALVSIGGAPKASIFLRKGKKVQAEKVLGSCTWMLLLLSLLITAVMLVFGRPICSCLAQARKPLDSLWII